MQNKPIYHYVPHWMSSELKNRFCTKCGKHIQKQNIIGIGIRNSENKSILYIEHKCPKCNYREITIAPKKNGTIEELCYIILDGVNQRKTLERSKIFYDKQKITQDKISKTEVDDLVKFMNSSKTYDEFLKYIKADKNTQKTKKHIRKRNEHPNKD